ncbi:hypothetical protein CC78DRAFT_577389 [Lojkania enalia]|uniref:Uncharacterized protein n=1 Tax=Lojkania enalia TaxID=147567 RepID=A0A9P4N8Y3_9PLEO|nr:hypothetical protein CC78DRAFT_577389 [Didymosphaeria enalia]
MPRKRSQQGSLSDIETRNVQVSGESKVTGSVGSNEDLGLLDEDVFRSHESRATGLMGSNSEVQWLRSLKNQVGGSNIARNIADQTPGPPRLSNDAYTQRARHLTLGTGYLGTKTPFTSQIQHYIWIAMNSILTLWLILMSFHH